ncbi:hypothetical protein SSP24_51250 [Streptomyces spinoverrucosus]|uniref:Uncharacterized protein n=1 Tax=Streptomyces spinoverrucosus TaxID=284043 RepID=A0A4Y3VP56_9ACTN|nr:hypothetical protein [Streptomyces spinoverrucosus]GEC07470.1 hypothetical protein SSP24_51250 [Streptomyces spinoverrucosus]GHB68265.1 hypothetical protein GCM10010397_43030 [Streptomyces spinoverrucosus]
MTTEAGGGRRRAWRWAVLVWAVTVAIGGGLTLWLQEPAEPPGPYRWEEATPSPMLHQDSACSPPTPLPTEDGIFAYACIVTND